MYNLYMPPYDRSAQTYLQVGECLVWLCHKGWRPLAEEPPRALRVVERPTTNPEKLANAGGRCWEDTLGRKEVIKDPPAAVPYQERISHCLARDKETLTGRNLNGQCRWGPEGENYRKLLVLVKRPKTKTKSGGALWKPHRQHSWRRKIKKKKKKSTSQSI